MWKGGLLGQGVGLRDGVEAEDVLQFLLDFGYSGGSFAAIDL